MNILDLRTPIPNCLNSFVEVIVEGEAFMVQGSTIGDCIQVALIITGKIDYYYIDISTPLEKEYELTKLDLKSEPKKIVINKKVG